jgi:hypothetical protein
VSFRSVWRACALVALVAAFLAVPRGAAWAVPSFATQTGQPCSACHIGAYGPQLTPFGMAFKIGGYTQTGGDGWQSYNPLSAMIIGSFTNTNSAVPADQVTPHYNTNNNFALDQISVFLAGRLGDNTGGFSQFTYSNVSNAVNVDNIDLRPYTRVFDAGGKDLRIGFTINNAPTVQDPYNTTFAWGYPYVASRLAPTPSASPILASGFVGNSIGYTAYAWYDRSLYLEAGGYTTVSPWALARIGNEYGVGSTQGVAPYVRAAYQWDWNSQSAHIGALYMSANVDPTVDTYITDGSNGRDSYQDYGIDAGYMWLGDGTHIVTTQGIFVHENQNLQGSAGAANAANGTSYGSNYGLNQLRFNTSYWYQNTYGATFGWQKSWGAANPVLYQPAELNGSANSKPNSNEFILEADWVPFGKADSFASPWVNLKLGVQYTIYTQFNGGTTNYDGYGRSASANNTLFVFAWMAF